MVGRARCTVRSRCSKSHRCRRFPGSRVDRPVRTLHTRGRCPSGYRFPGGARTSAARRAARLTEPPAAGARSVGALAERHGGSGGRARRTIGDALAGKAAAAATHVSFAAALTDAAAGRAGRWRVVIFTSRRRFCARAVPQVFVRTVEPRLAAPVAAARLPLAAARSTLAICATSGVGFAASNLRPTARAAELPRLAAAAAVTRLAAAEAIAARRTVADALAGDATAVSPARTVAAAWLAYPATCRAKAASTEAGVAI